MELYLEPTWIKKDPRFKKGHTPWNKGVKGFQIKDPEKVREALDNLAAGRQNSWDKRRRDISWNSSPVSAYDLAGNYVGTYNSSSTAGRKLGINARNIRSCITGIRKRVGNYQFRKANIILFQGETLVKKSPIEAYKQKTRGKGKKKGVKGGEA